jgi:hypothetical protein
MSVSRLTPEQTLLLIGGTLGLTDHQAVKYAELVPAMLTSEGYADPDVFDHQIDVARELAVWMTSDDFNELAGEA